MFRLVFVFVLMTLQRHSGTNVGAQSRHKLSVNDPSEIARQNKITEQILAQYIQRKFFPHLSPPQIPRIDYLGGVNRQATISETDDTDPDALETVETEQVSKVYDEENTGEEEPENEEENTIEGGPR